MSSLLAQSRQRLEVGPGLRPHLPVEGTRFVDISIPALAQLCRRGAAGVAGNITALPFADATFDLVCALDIVEHVEDDERALSELCRVTQPGGAMLLSMPLYAARWTAFDDLAGHRHRYEPADLLLKLAAVGLVVEQSAIYGMQPSSTRVVDLGTWFLTHHRMLATWFYNNLIMPLALHLQDTLALHPGVIETKGVDEILLVCRKRDT